MLQLRWLRLIAIDFLEGDELDIIVDYTTRFQTHNQPNLENIELDILNDIYTRVRQKYLRKNIYEKTE